MKYSTKEITEEEKKNWSLIPQFGPMTHNSSNICSTIDMERKKKKKTNDLAFNSVKFRSIFFFCLFEQIKSDFKRFRFVESVCPIQNFVCVFCRIKFETLIHRSINAPWVTVCVSSFLTIVKLNWNAYKLRYQAKWHAQIDLTSCFKAIKQSTEIIEIQLFRPIVFVQETF